MNIKDNEFLEELVNNKTTVALFLGNGYQMKGRIVHLYGDFIKFATTDYLPPCFIRYSFISTIKPLSEVATGGDNDA